MWRCSVITSYSIHYTKLYELAAGLRTGDIAAAGERVVGTRAMGDAVVAAL